MFVESPCRLGLGCPDPRSSNGASRPGCRQRDSVTLPGGPRLKLNEVATEQAGDGQVEDHRIG